MTKPWPDMTPREQDAALAELMGWDLDYVFRDTTGAPLVCGEPHVVPKFTASLDAIRLVEDEVERQGLQERYIEVLDKLVEYERAKGWTWFRWGILRATPAQRAQAAYAVLREQHAIP